VAVFIQMRTAQTMPIVRIRTAKPCQPRTKGDEQGHEIHARDLDDGQHAVEGDAGVVRRFLVDLHLVDDVALRQLSMVQAR
jgi:hypothetical protein